MDSFSYVGLSCLLSGFSRSFGCTYTGVFLPLVPPSFFFLVGGWSSPMTLRRLLLSLLPSPLPAVLRFLCTVRSFCLGSFLLVYMTCCSLVSCSLFAWVPGCFVARAPLCLSAILHSSWGSRLLPSRLPPSSSFLLGFISFVPLWLCLAISFLPFIFQLVSIRTFRHLPSLATVSSVPVRYSFFLCVCVCLVGVPGFSTLFVCFPWFTFLSFLPFSHFLSFFRRSSDSVESPLHSATVPPFGQSQLLFSLFPLLVCWSSHA